MAQCLKIVQITLLIFYESILNFKAIVKSISKIQTYIFGGALKH